MKVCHWNIQEDGPLTETALINKLERMGYRCTRYTYPPGTFFSDQQYNLDKIDAVLKGQMKIDSSGESILLNPGDYVHISRNTSYSVEVVGDVSVVSIDAIKAG